MTRTVISSETKLYQKLLRKHKKISKYLKRSGRELKKRIPNLDKVKTWQLKTSKLLKDIVSREQEKSSTSHVERSRSSHQSSPPPNKQALTFTLRKISERNVKKFGTYSCAFRAKVSSIIENSNNLLKDFMNSLQNVFSDAIDEVKTKCNLNNSEKDRIRVMVTSDSFKKPLSTRLVSVSEQRPSLILSEIAKVLQSAENLPLDESFVIDIVALKLPVGKGRGLKVLDYSKHTKLKRSIITIMNKDQLCLARAIVTAREIANKGPKVLQLKKGRPVQKRLAVLLHHNAHVPLGPCGLQEIDKFQTFLSDFQIVVISFSNRNNVIYEGPKRDKRIILYYNDGHFDVINPDKLPAFFGKRAKCNLCSKYINNQINHPCLNICKVCERKSCRPNNEKPVECPLCNKYCRSQDCLLAHQKESKLGSSKCQQSFRCTICNSTVEAKRKDVHVCYEYKCWNCKEFVSLGHLCYMQNQDPKSPSENLLFFDFETDQSSGEHVVNFAVCQDFLGTTKVFKGYDALDNFCTFLFDDQHKGFSAIAHHGKAFDNIFLLRWLLENRPTADIRIIRTGNKLMQLYAADYDIRVIDSINWFQMPLAKLPKTFGLDESKMSKGTFPHLFNTKDHFGYIGSMPDIQFYSPDTLSKEARLKLLSWHAEMCDKNYVFDFDQELERYCIQDVNILRESCIRFREIFLSEMDVDPFRYITIAATVMSIFKAKFLQPHTIGIVPNDLYRGVNKMYSDSSIQWLDFISALDNKKIVHAVNQGEHIIVDRELGKTYHVDGFCKETNEVFEFLGCLFHAHDKCFDQHSSNPLRRDTMNSTIYQDTMDRLARLEELGYSVKYIWECDFNQIKQSKVFKNFIANHEIIDSLNPRDAFYGGRTNSVKLYHSCKSGEKVKYVDFTSLYPFVNKTKS